MKSYNELFVDRFDKSTIIDETFANICNKKGIKCGIEYLKEIGATELDTDNYNIKYRISEWTKNELSDTEKINLLKGLKDFKDYVGDVNIIINPKFNLPEVIVETKNGGVIKAIQLSSLIPQVKETFPYIEDYRRFGNCYDFTYNISLNLGVENEVVTGYIWGYSDKAKYLHSWVEVTIKGEEYVIDGTLNAIINKEGYYIMQHAKVLNRINVVDLKADVKKYMSKIKSVPLEVYFVFRNEIIKDLERNQNVFKK